MRSHLLSYPDCAVGSLPTQSSMADRMGAYQQGSNMNEKQLPTLQPAQATQAEVTDEQIFDVLKKVDPEAKRLPPGISKFARAILALRPVQVPMTDEQAFHVENNHPDSMRMCPLSFRLGIRAAEAHHGIKPKEQA